MGSREQRTSILLFLDDRHQKNPSLTVDDVEISAALGISVEEVRRQLDILGDQGLIQEANTFEGHSASISPKGMAAADDLRE